MADVVVNIDISLVSYKTWLTTSYMASSIITEDGKPLIVSNELGPDQEDAFDDMIKEAAREISKLFLSRQGDVTGTPFEFATTEVIYRFAEGEPVLKQAAAIKDTLNEDVKNALFIYVTYLWLKIKNNKEQSEFLISRYNKLTDNINIHLYKLHD